MAEPFDKVAAMDALAALPLERSNGELAAYWFAHWRGGALPQRLSILPGKLRAFLPNVVLFNVVPDESVTVRLAGTRSMHIFGLHAASGEDWIAGAADDNRAARLKRFSRIARGAIAVETLRLPSRDGDDYAAQEMLLPFAPDADGIVAVLAHVHLRLDRYLKVEPLTTASEPADVRILALKPDEAPTAAVAVA